MFRAVNRPVPKAKPQSGEVYPFTIPYRGLDARSPFAVMPKDFAIELVNVVSETYGLRTRKGYTEWATNIPGGSVSVSTIMSYYPPTVDPVVTALAEYDPDIMFISPLDASGPAGTLFAAKGGFIYDVTTGGTGPWVAEVGVTGTSDYWTSVNLSNIAGSHLLACNENGGYTIYNGTVWDMPIQGVAPGEIENVNPANLCYLITYKKRVWFVEKNTTRAWYLPVDQITGKATMFDFGSQFDQGGQLVALECWSMDSGNGMDDQLVAVSSQGDVCVYAGIDPEDAAGFNIVGTFYCGPLPVGRRSVRADGGDVYILSQFGVQQLSKLMTTQSLAAQEAQRLTYEIDPLIARIMQTEADHLGWQILDVAREELMLVGIPRQSTTMGGDFLAYKTTTKSWSTFDSTNYASVRNINTLVFAGTYDGRVVKAFNGALDNVLIGSLTGDPIKCRVTPAYNSLDKPALYKHAMMLRPSFLATETPKLTITMLSDYGPPKEIVTPTLPNLESYRWDNPASLWDVAKWGGLLLPIKQWLGIAGLGFALTPQLDYYCGGDTLLTNIDIWFEPGGVM